MIHSQHKTNEKKKKIDWSNSQHIITHTLKRMKEKDRLIPPFDNHKTNEKHWRLI